MSTVLELRDVYTGFGANTVLHGCSYEVPDGSVTAVLGLNGAGKSVSLKVAGGIQPVWKGAVLFDGTEVTKKVAEDRVRDGIGHVPQGRQVFPDLTVEQNLRLGAYVLRRRDRGRYDEVLERILERFPILRERMDQAAGTLSGGQQAMLAVGRGLMSEPKLLIVDEPTAGLSPAAVQELSETVHAVHDSGVTILMVEQNVPFALRIADRIHVMQRGTIVYEGAADALDSDRLAELLGIGRLLKRAVGGAAPVTSSSA